MLMGGQIVGACSQEYYYVIGSGPYSAYSDICGAALHAGIAKCGQRSQGRFFK